MAERILLLDVDGVLVIPPDWYGVRLRREAPEETARFMAEAFLPASVGEVDLMDHLPNFVSALGRSCSAEEFLEEWHEYENFPDHSLIDLVAELRDEGWKVFLATNQNRYRLRHLLDVSGLGAIVDGEFASCSIGHRKPSPEYFAEVTRRLGVEPDGIVFFDDVEENVVAAREAGWSAHLYVGVDCFKRILNDL